MCTCENKEECKKTKEDKKQLILPVVILEVIILVVVFLGGLHYLSGSGKKLIDSRENIRDNIKKEIIAWSQSQPNGIPTSNIIMNYYQCQNLYRFNHSECLAITGNKSFKSAVTGAIIKSDAPQELKDKFLGINQK